jgi:short-subunit dehydrogenase involved in D-alanine esterification of teichoic acids
MGGKTVLITGGTSGIVCHRLWEISEDLTGLKVAA